MTSSDVRTEGQRDRALQALRDSEARFRALVEHSPVGVWQITPDGHTIYVNPAMCEMLEIESAEEIAGVLHFDFFTPESAERMRREEAKRPRGIASTYEAELVGRQGTRRLVRVSGAPIFNPGGRLESLMGTITDITEEKRAEKELRRANETLRALFEAAPLAIYTLNAEGLVDIWNPGAERIFGWKATEVVGKPLPIIPEDKVREFAELRARVMSGEGFTGLELRRRRKDGSPVDLRLYTAPLYSAEGAVAGIMAVAADVSEQKALEAQLRQSQKLEAIGLLAGGVAHDFNNILTAVMGSVDLLLFDTLPDDSRRTDIEEIKQAAERASALTSQLLAFSRRSMLQPRLIDINALVHETERLLRRMIGEDVALEMQLGDGVGAVEADPTQLQQVLMNLAVNARDAMPQGGHLTLSTTTTTLTKPLTRQSAVISPNEYVVLSVSDTGHGMEEATLARVFEPFFTTKELGKGTGLGLAMVYGFVKQSGGYVVAESAPGKGTTFTVYLPRAAGEAERLDTDLSRDGLEGTETILLVEDEESVRHLGQRILRRYGYTVLAASNAQEARDMFDRHRNDIDLLLTDLIMPHTSGRVLADQLLTRRPGLRVLFVSGYTGDTLKNHGLSDGSPFLQKPFTPDGLARAVRRVLDR